MREAHLLLTEAASLAALVTRRSSALGIGAFDLRGGTVLTCCDLVTWGTYQYELSVTAGSDSGHTFLPVFRKPRD